MRGERSVVQYPPNRFLENIDFSGNNFEYSLDSYRIDSFDK